MAMEHYYAKHHSYTKDGKTLLTINDLPHQHIPDNRSGGQRGYDYTMTATASGYTLTATPKGDQRNASGGGKECGVFHVDQSGNYQIKPTGTNKFVDNTRDCFR